MLDKIKKAREIIKEYNEIYNIDIILKLEETADEAEFIFNNLEMNQAGSYAAFIKLQELEQELDELLKETENKKIKNEEI